MTSDSSRRVPPELVALRGSIDNIDAALVHLLAERFKCTQRVGRLKAEAGIPPSDPDREAQQVHRLRALAAEAGLDPVFAEKFLEFIVTEVIRHHEEIASSHADAVAGHRLRSGPSGGVRSVGPPQGVSGGS